jgi:hypothetical protein
VTGSRQIGGDKVDPSGSDTRLFVLEPEVVVGYQLERWQRHGHDRLYVRSASRKLGWIDLKTGHSTSTADQDWPSPVLQAVKQWLAQQGLGHLRVQLEPSRRTDQATQEHLARPGDPDRFVPSAQNTPGRQSATIRSVDDAQESAVRARGRDLAKNRAGSAAYAAAREHTTWWRQLGGEGEVLVGRTLSWARIFGWRVLHAVPVGDRGSDIDHVLIGPGGVITINTKHHLGQRVRVKSDVVFVGKTAKKYGHVSQHEAARAARLLTAAAGRPVPVRSAVVIVGARSVRGSRSAGVEVMPKSHLLVWLLVQRRVFSRSEASELYEIARRSTMWQPPARR